MLSLRILNKSLRAFIPVFTLFCVFSHAGSALADTLFLKNGRSIEGLIKEDSSRYIELNVGFGTVRFEKNLIEEIRRSSPLETAEIESRWERERLKAERTKAVAEGERQRSIIEWREKKESASSEAQYEPKSAAVAKKRGQIVVDTLLNGNVRASLVLDTGASLVMLTAATARKLGVEPEKEGASIQVQVADGRRINAKFITLDSVEVSGAEAKNVEAAVLTDETASPGFGDGLLGMSYLRRFNFHFDYENERLVLEKNR